MAHRSAGDETGLGVGYCCHRPEDTLLYQIIERYYPLFAELRAEQGRALPPFVQREFEEYLKCGRLEHGFLRVRCSECHTEKLVAFSCKRRGFCPSCGARRMIDSAALLVDEVLLHVPIRQWVLSVPFPIWFLFAGLPDSPYYELAQKYTNGKPSALLTFGIKGGYDAGVRFYDVLNLFLRLVNIGDTKSLAAHPASTNHRQLSDDELEAAGVTPDMIRLCIGIEHIDDIVADLDQALEAAA